MSALRINVPGQPVRLIDLGPGVGRRTFTRGVVYGGVMVVGSRRTQTVAQAEAAKREYERRYYHENKDKVIERQRRYRAKLKPPCGKWIILARHECTKPVRHQGACA